MALKDVAKAAIPDSILWEREARKRRNTAKRCESLPMNEWKNDLARWYEENTGKMLDLEHPTTLGEKTQWLKLWDSTPEKGALADKYESKSIAAGIIGADHIIPALGVWSSFDEIDFELLPESFVLKVTDASGANLFVTEKSSLDMRNARARMRTWLSSGSYAFSRGSYELHYAYITPRIVAEPLLDLRGDDLVDYRFWCGSKGVFSVWCDTGSATHEYHRSVFTPDWELVDVCATHPRHEASDVPVKPSCYKEMLEMARELSRGFSLARVDFYEYEGKPLLGEVTFTPQSGAGWFDPESFDEWMGKNIALPAEKKPFRGVVL